MSELWSERLEDWPKLEGHYECTAEKPMPRNPDPPGQWIHHGAETVTSTDDYSENWKCAHCGARWSQELPE